MKRVDVLRGLGAGKFTDLKADTLRCDAGALEVCAQLVQEMRILECAE